MGVLGRWREHQWGVSVGWREPETAKLIPSRFFGSRLVFTKADIRIDCIVFIKKLLLLVSFKNRQRPLSGFEARTTQSRFSKN